MRFTFDDIAYTLETLPEDPTPQQFKMLKREALEQIPYQRFHWRCQAKGCTHGTHIRDYGISPHYFLDRNSKGSCSNPTKYWVNLATQYWFCGKHWKVWDRLKKSFAEDHIEQKVLDFSKTPMELLTPVGAD